MAERKRGGQPGNLNGLKHGFYSRQFRAGEVNDLEASTETGLVSEITMLRVICRRIFEYASESEPDDITQWSQLLNSLSLAASRMAGLLRQQRALGSGTTDVAAALSAALAEVTRDFKLGQPAPKTARTS